MTGLDKIIDRILQDAQNDAQATRAEAQSRCDAIAAEWSERAEACRCKLEQDAQTEAENIAARTKATLETERRNMVLGVRSRLLEQVWEDAMNEVKAFPPDRYARLLCHLLAEALREQHRVEEDSRTLYGEEGAAAPEKYEVLLNEHDHAFCGETLMTLFRAAAGQDTLLGEMAKKVVLAEESAPIDGGLVLRAGDIESNCSLSAMFRTLREQNEQKVLKTLFPEPTAAVGKGK